MPDLIRSKTAKARKTHKCQTCSETAVEPGQTYTRDTYAYEGTVYDWVQCTACSALTDAVWDWIVYTDEGISREEYYEWANEFVDEDTPNGEAARAYLERIGEFAPTPVSNTSEGEAP